MKLLKIFRFTDFIQYFPDFLLTKFFKVRKCERCGSLNPCLSFITQLSNGYLWTYLISRVHPIKTKKRNKKKHLFPHIFIIIVLFLKYWVYFCIFLPTHAWCLLSVVNTQYSPSAQYWNNSNNILYRVSNFRFIINVGNIWF